jgi:hypothetical protein
MKGHKTALQYEFPQKEMSQLFGIKNRRGLSITGWLKIWYSLCGYVHNWVKWLERESDDKTLRKVEILSGAKILSLYMSVLST